MFIFRINPESFTTPDDYARLLAFMADNQLAPRGSAFCWSQPPAGAPVTHPDYTQVDPRPGPVDLEVCFLDRPRSSIEKKLESLATPLLVIGHKGVPEAIDHMCIPFEMGRLFRTDWLSEIMAAAHPHKIRLLNSDNGLVAREVMKIAQWFRMDSVRSSMREWVTEDLKSQLHDLMSAYPDAEVKAEVGSMLKAFEDEDPKRMLLAGCLTRGLHLLHRHHGLAYGALLHKTGASGYFIGS